MQRLVLMPCIFFGFYPGFDFLNWAFPYQNGSLLRFSMSDVIMDNNREEGDHDSQSFLEQEVFGSKRLSNYLLAGLVSVGGLGFTLASLSSYLAKDLLPLGHPSTLIFVPQGLVMGLYGIAGVLLAVYLWTLITIDFGAGINRFNKDTGSLLVTRKGFFKDIKLEVPLNDIQAVRLELRDGINPRRRISLKIKGRRDLPLSGVGQPVPLAELEEEGAQLALFLGVNLEGL